MTALTTDTAAEVAGCGKAPEMTRIAGLIVDVLQERRPVEAVQRDAGDLRRSFPTLHYCFAPEA